MSIKNLVPLNVKNSIRKIYYQRKYSSLKILSNVVLGNNNTFEEGVTLNDSVNVSKTSIGKYTYIAPRTHINRTKIGRYCSIGPEVLCGLGVHPTSLVSTHPSFFSTKGQSQIVFADSNYFDEVKETILGNDVWVGARVTILDGLTIGDGAIIGAGSIVTKDVPPYAIVVGNPAKIIKYRFENEIIEKLLEIKWWTWEVEKIEKNKELFLDVDSFVRKLKY